MKSRSTQKQIKYDKKLPSGDMFMPDMTKEAIYEKIKKMLCGKPRYILSACYIRKRGASLREIARQLMKPFSTVRGWLARMAERGIEGMWDKKSTGRKKILNRSDLKMFEEWLYTDPVTCDFQSASWNMDMIVVMFERIHGVCRCTKRTLQMTMKRMGFSYSKPRPIPYQSASLEEQQKFKNDTNEEITRLRKLRYTIIAGDEAGILKGSAAGYGWRPKNGCNTIQIKFDTKPVKIFGALTADKIYMQIYDTLGSDAFIDFLKKIFKIHGRFVMILDNAPGHTSKTLNDFIESMHGKIVLIYLPSHTPQLNPIEPQWTVLKRLLAGRDFKSEDDLAYAVNTLIETNQMKPVKLWDYLVPSKSRKAGIL